LKKNTKLFPTLSVVHLFTSSQISHCNCQWKKSVFHRELRYTGVAVNDLETQACLHCNSPPSLSLFFTLRRQEVKNTHTHTHTHTLAQAMKKQGFRPWAVAWVMDIDTNSVFCKIQKYCHIFP
jgi:hypothetical protein